MRRFDFGTKERRWQPTPRAAAETDRRRELASEILCAVVAVCFAFWVL